MIDALHDLEHQYADRVQIRPLRLVDLEQIPVGRVHDDGARADAFAEAGFLKQAGLVQRQRKLVVSGRRDRLHDVARVELLIVAGLLLVFPLLLDLEDLNDNLALLAEQLLAFCNEHVLRETPLVYFQNLNVRAQPGREIREFVVVQCSITVLIELDK